MHISFENKAGIVTGGSSGIGKATALAFAGAGVKPVRPGKNLSSINGSLRRKIHMAHSTQILVVEDDRSLQESLVRLLMRKGAIIHLAGNLSKAGAHLRKNEFDIFLVDYKLPDGNGLELYEGCKNNPRMERFILMTGFNTQNLELPEQGLCPLSTLQKPFRTKQLLDLVANRETVIPEQ